MPVLKEDNWIAEISSCAIRVNDDDETLGKIDLRDVL